MIYYSDSAINEYQYIIELGDSAIQDARDKMLSDIKSIGQLVSLGIIVYIILYWGIRC